MKIILLFLFLFTFPTLAAAQESCGLTASPALLGLRLNMSPEQAQSVFGRDLKISVKNNSERTIFENFIENKPPASLSGVRALYLRFIDRRIYQIEVFYEEMPAVKTLQDFTASLAARLNFPVSEWEYEENRAVINCGGFTLVAHKTLNPRVELTDEAARAKVEAIRQEKK
jgi:hypothetical protein